MLHAVLGWHPSDLEWLTREHLADTVRAALNAMGLKDRQSIWVTHTDTGRPHVHIVANLVHPDTGLVARLGLIKKRMSTFCAAYEQSLGDVRCKRRLMPKAVNENRSRQARAGRASSQAPRQAKGEPFARPSPLTVIGIPACTVKLYYRTMPASPAWFDRKLTRNNQTPNIMQYEKLQLLNHLW